MTGKNVVDSSAWLEYFANTNRTHLFARAIENDEALIVPVICIYEVFKKIMRERGEDSALRAVSVMKNGRVIDLDESLILEAAYYRLPLADSLIYATTIRLNAELWTQDDHFQGLPNVQYFPK